MQSRKSNKSYFDQHNQLRDSDGMKFSKGDLVLLYKSKDHISRGLATKLADKWIGPYRVTEAPEDSTFYRLEELDSTPLARTFAENRLKKFFPRDARIDDRTTRD